MDKIKCEYCQKTEPRFPNIHNSCCMWSYFETEDLSDIPKEDKEIYNYEIENNQIHYSKKLIKLLDLNPSNTFYQSLFNQYIEKQKLSEKQIECILKKYKTIK